MTAEDARAIVSKNIYRDAVPKLLNAAANRIREFAERGETKVTHPFYPLPLHEFPKPGVQAALKELENRGFTVRHVPNPDPDDQRSSDYDEVSW